MTARKGVLLSSATGFFYKIGKNIFLVSNWHVFAGRNIYTGQPLMQSGAIPDELRIPFHHRDNIGKYTKRCLALEDNEGNIKWRQHPAGQDVDVAALEIDLPADDVVYELPKLDETADMAFKVSMDAFILGFPSGVSQQFWPIWKRASIATEPEIKHDNLPVFLVDSATREGMSGAPVLLRSVGMYESQDGGMVGGGAYTRFVGIYSGRFGVSGDELSAQLGRVWHRRVIDEIISDGVPGNFVLR